MSTSPNQPNKPGTMGELEVTEKERDYWRSQCLGSSVSRMRAAAEADRDAAINRAESAEKERDQFREALKQILRSVEEALKKIP